MKLTRRLLLGIMAVLMISMLGGCDSAKAEKTIESFIENIENGDYAAAEAMLEFTVDSPNNSFSVFAENNLQNLKYKIGETTENETNVTLSGDSGDFDVRLIKYDDKYKISADEFLMSYKVHYISLISSGHNSFTGNGRYIGNGIMEYTKYVYKCDSVTLNFDAILGGEQSLAPGITASVNFDENYKPCEVTAHNYLNEEDDMSDFVKIKDDAIVLNKYCVSEEYSKSMALTFSSMFSDMCDSALNGGDYASFESWHKDYIVENSENIKDNFASLNAAAGYMVPGMSYEVELISWNYDQYYLLDESYVMSITVKLNSYNQNGYKSDSGDATEWYVRFIPNEDKFLVLAMGDYDKVASVPAPAMLNDTDSETGQG